jgi:hypothetical protein
MRYFYIKITGGTSSGPYNIYYDAVGPNTFATGYTSGTNTTNITYSELTSGSGFAIQVPDSVTSILLVNLTGKGDCEPVVYSLGSPPVNLPNLCFEFRQDYSGPITQYNFILTDQIYNDRPVWSSQTYNVKWDSVEQYWFVENWTQGIMVNTNPATPPISGWVVLGSLSTVTVSAGECRPTAFKIKNVVVTNPTCLNNGCSGGLEIQTESATPPILYSIDNGATTSSSPLFINLCPSTYTAWSKDANNLISTQTVVVPVGNNSITEYNLRLETTTTTTQQGGNGVTQLFITKRFDFVVRVKDVNNNNITQLPPGTIINFNLLQNNVFDRTPGINSGNINRTISIQKNGVELSLNTTSTDTTLNDTRPFCTNTSLYSIYKTNTQKTANVQIQNNDVISGYVITQLTKILIPGQVTGCTPLVNSVDSVQLDTARIEGCNCCSANTLKTDIPSMTSNL